MFRWKNSFIGIAYLVTISAFCLSSCNVKVTADLDTQIPTPTIAAEVETSGSDSPPAGSPLFVSFEDVDSTSGTVSGVISIGKAPRESDITGYQVYWADAAGTTISVVGTASATGADVNMNVASGTVLPAGACQVVATSINDGGESSSNATQVFLDLMPNLLFRVAADQKVYSDVSGATPILAIDGDRVARWNDLSPQNLTLNPIRSLQKPTYVASGIAGRPALRFDKTAGGSSGEGLYTSAGLGQNSSAVTVFAVGQIDVMPDYWSILVSNISAGNNYAEGFGILSNSNRLLDLLLLETSNFRFPATTSLGVPFLVGGTDPQALTLNGRLGVGIRPFDGWIPYDGLISEIIIYGSALSSTEKAGIIDYLKLRYGIQ